LAGVPYGGRWIGIVHGFGVRLHDAAGASFRTDPTSYRKRDSETSSDRDRLGIDRDRLVNSPWGKRSGAHLHPSFTLAFWSLGKVGKVDACFYVLSQFAGGVLGVLVAAILVGKSSRGSTVN